MKNVVVTGWTFQQKLFCQGQGTLQGLQLGSVTAGSEIVSRCKKVKALRHSRTRKPFSRRPATRFPAERSIYGDVQVNKFEHFQGLGVTVW